MGEAIYFDFAATTAMSDAAKKSMEQATGSGWGNASAIHQAAQKSAASISKSRKSIATLLEVNSEELIFTSGGSESNNLAIKGQVISWNQKGITPHILSSRLEHPSVTKSLEQLVALQWAEVDWVNAKPDGTPDLEDLQSKIKPTTQLACFMAVSNETGAIFPIAAISKILKAHQISLHVDAVQAALTLDLSILASYGDSLSLSGHKVYGPKGIGLLVKKQNLTLTPLITGGAQENALRAGTENTPAILGFATALAAAQENLNENQAHFKELKSTLITGLKANFPDSVVIADGSDHILSFLFLPHEAGRVLRKLDLKGFALASGSACSTGNPEPSESLLAMGIAPEKAKSLIRVSFGLSSSLKEVNQLLTALKEVANG